MNKKTSLIALPPHSEGQSTHLPEGIHTVVIVGANGAGKSRFAAALADNAKQRAYKLSALNALYTKNMPSESNSEIDRLYIDKFYPGSSSQVAESTTFDRLMEMLMHDEMLNLLSFKLRLAEHPDTKLRRTRLDEIISLWQEIFPDNRVLIESGKLLFSRHDSSSSDGSDPTDIYSAVKLSAGEKTVIYYLAAASYAPHNALIMVDAPEMFLHPTIMQSVWNRIEMMRPDCTFIYTTHALDFAASRSAAAKIWVRNFDAAAKKWDYRILPPEAEISNEIYTSILGSRKPVLFIEGDVRNSIDIRLYSLIFRDFTVKPLGSCNKVIEATRAFNTLGDFHQMDSYGIVDRDRRDSHEVEYLRQRRIMVPDVAEVENILILEDVVKAVARYRGKNEQRVFDKVRRAVIHLFAADLKQQALLHTRHRVKRTMEYRIDARFQSIDMLEQHMQQLTKEIAPRRLYESFVHEFNLYVKQEDYAGILRVYNQKSMLPACNVASLVGLNNKDEYIAEILKILRGNSSEARLITKAIRKCFSNEENPI